MPQTHIAGMIFASLTPRSRQEPAIHLPRNTREKERREEKKQSGGGMGEMEKEREKILPLFQKTEQRTALAGEARDPDFPPGSISWVAGDKSCDLSGPQFPLCQQGTVATLST